MNRTLFASLFCLGMGMVLTSHSHYVSAQTIVAHRGASYDAPENTLSAFREAWKQNADGVEGDFYITADRQVVCIHDADTKRTAGKKLEVAKSTLAELRALEYGNWKDPKFAGEPIPTFDEVMDAVPPGKLFVIELKVGPDIVPLLKKRMDAEINGKTGREFLFICFKAETVAKCKELFPNIRAHWLTGFKQDRATGKWTPDVETICKTVKETKADGVGMKGEVQLIDDKFVKALKDGGCREFHVWTVDEPADAAHFKALGAVGITTNRPQFIRDSLSGK